MCCGIKGIESMESNLLSAFAFSHAASAEAIILIERKSFSVSYMPFCLSNAGVELFNPVSSTISPLSFNLFAMYVPICLPIR